MKIDPVLIILGIIVIVIIVKDPGSIGAFTKDVISIPGHVSTYVRSASGAARESFRG